MSFIFGIMGALGKITRVSKKLSGKHLIHNEQVFVNCTYLVNQPELSTLEYGKNISLFNRLLIKERNQETSILTAAFNACEVMATMNSLVNLRLEKDASTFPRLLNYFERKGIVLWGYFGTAPGAVKKYLKTRGVTCVDMEVNAGGEAPDLATIKESDKRNKNFDTYILFATVGKNIFSGIHTMCIVKRTDGYKALNDFIGNRTYPTLKAAVAGSCRNGKVLKLWGLHNAD